MVRRSPSGLVQRSRHPVSGQLEEPRPERGRVQAGVPTRAIAAAEIGQARAALINNKPKTRAAKVAIIKAYTTSLSVRRLRRRRLGDARERRGPWTWPFQGDGSAMGSAPLKVALIGGALSAATSSAAAPAFRERYTVSRMNLRSGASPSSMGAGRLFPRR